MRKGLGQLGDMDLRLLRVFKSVVDCGGMAAAELELNIGTSTEAVARELLHHRNILVVTNNIHVSNILMANPECEIIVTGGSLRRADGGLVGKVAADTIGAFKFDLAVIGCSAIDPDGDLLDFDIHEVGVSQAVLRQSRRAFLVADHSKLARTAPARITSLSEIDAFFTDRELPAPLAANCREWSTEVVIAGAPPPPET